MGSLFASHKSRLFKKLAVAAVVLGFVMMLFNGGGGSSSDTTGKAREYKQHINYTRVYSNPSVAPTPTATAQVNSQASEAIITAAAKEAANEFIVAWTTYDYQKPPTYGQIPSAAQDDVNNGTLKPKFDALLKDMANTKELSTGNVGSLNITQLNYRGDNINGTGNAVIKATMNITISNSEVGSAGSSLVRTYEIRLTRDQQGGANDRNKWVVMDVITLS